MQGEAERLRREILNDLKEAIGQLEEPNPDPAHAEAHVRHAHKLLRPWAVEFAKTEYAD